MITHWTPNIRKKGKSKKKKKTQREAATWSLSVHMANDKHALTCRFKRGP